MRTSLFGPRLPNRAHIVIYKNGCLGLPIAIQYDADGGIHDAIQAVPLTIDDRRMPRKPIARLIARMDYDAVYAYIGDAFYVESRLPTIWTF